MVVSSTKQYHSLSLDERRVVFAQAKAMVKKEQEKNQPSQQKSVCANFYSWSSDGWTRLFRRDTSDDESSSNGDSTVESSAVFVERFMTWYARTLLKPRVRNSVIVFCLLLFGVCIYNTTQLTQKFDPQDYVPDDSYTQGFFDKCTFASSFHGYCTYSLMYWLADPSTFFLFPRSVQLCRFGLDIRGVLQGCRPIRSIHSATDARLRSGAVEDSTDRQGTRALLGY